MAWVTARELRTWRELCLASRAEWAHALGEPQWFVVYLELGEMDPPAGIGDRYHAAQRAIAAGGRNPGQPEQAEEP